VDLKVQNFRSWPHFDSFISLGNIIGIHKLIKNNLSFVPKIIVLKFQKDLPTRSKGFAWTAD